MSHQLRDAAEGRSTCRKFLPLAAALVLLIVGLIATPRPAGAQGSASNVVISQIYTRGGEPGAAYQSDFVEIFNRGNSSVDINGYALQVTALDGSSSHSFLMTFVSSRGLVVEPGKYALIELAGGTQGGQPLPAPDLPARASFLNLGSTGGHVALYRKAPVFQFGSCPTGPDLADVVGYGAGATCWEGSGPAAVAPDAASALLRTRGGCDDNTNSASDFRAGAPNPRNSSTPRTLCLLPSGPSMIQFALPQFNAPEFEGRFPVTVTRSGDTGSPATVGYAVDDGTADERQDYTTALGTLRFEPGETVKTFDVLLTDDADAEGNETINLSLFDPTGATLGTRFLSTIVVHDNDFAAVSFNPADDPQFFARQHYHDFLNREPDGPGLFFWTNQITECGANVACTEVRRINVSAAFFQSIEFQETGFLVHRIYRAAFPPSPQRPRGLPRFREFVRDTQEMGRGVVVGVGDWRLRLDANQRSFVDGFVGRAEFRALYPSTMTAAEYVDALDRNAGGVIPTQLREQMIFNLNSGAFTRAEVLRVVAENRQFTAAEKNQAFVLMQYFGYLRRNPDDAPQPGLDFSGYDFWLGKLNDHGGDFIAAEMVKAFITSPEYLRRFASRQ